MKKILIALGLILLCSTMSFAQDNQWFIIKYKYYSGPVSPEYQKTYTVTIESDGNANISYHQGLEKTAPIVENFTVSKSNRKKITSAIRKTGILDGTAPVDTSDGKIGGSNKTITISYGNPDPNLDQPPREVTFSLWTYSPDEIKKLFALMDKMTPKKVWKKIEKNYEK
jgi:hypothetical protein